MERFLIFIAVLGSFFIFACPSKNSSEEPSSSSEVSSSSEISSSSEGSSSSEMLSLSSSSSAQAASSSSARSSSSAVASSSSVVASSSSAKSSNSVAISSSSAIASSSSAKSSSSVAISSSSAVAADPKDNFHIYLAFGQSNMEGQNWSNGQLAYGQDVLPTKYKQNVDKRFQVMTAVAGTYKLASGTEKREQGQWYTAVPPLLRNTLGLSPVDYFGRTLVEGISDPNIKVGVIAVAVAGSAIEGLEKGNGANTYFSSQQDFMKQIAAIYDNNPYNRLLTLAKEAQKVGVIKGIIMHQGESGAASGNWAQKVKGIYDNLLSDLELPANSIPFLAGQAYGGSTSNNNGTISALCNTMSANIAGSANKVCHVISSSGCTSGGDNLHFSYDGYEKLGTRYGEKMLELLYSN